VPLDNIGAARDAVFAHFTTIWNTITPTVPTLQYQGKIYDRKPEPNAAWAKIMMLHNPAAAGQHTLAGESGSVRHTRRGQVIVMIMTPTADNDGLTDADEYARVAMTAFEGGVTAPDRVLFRNASPVEVGPDGPWEQVNVVADFEYDVVV